MFLCHLHRGQKRISEDPCIVASLCRYYEQYCQPQHRLKIKIEPNNDGNKNVKYFARQNDQA